MDLIKELCRLYYEEEKGYVSYLSPNEAERYFERLLDKDRILYFTDARDTDKEFMVAYCEFWTITFSQFGRIANDEAFFPEEEDINSGNICYISSLCVMDGYRYKDYIHRIRKILLEKCPNIEYFTGFELKRKRRLRYYKVRR